MDRGARRKADSASSVNGQTLSAVHEAAADNNVEAMKILLSDKSQQQDLVNSVVGGRTPLVVALNNPATSPEMIQLLLDAGSDVDYKTSFGPPLRYAVAAGNLDIVKLLVAAGAAVNGEFDPISDTPLHYAANTKNVEMLRYFLDICDWRVVNECDESALYYACSCNFTKGVELLLKYVDMDAVLNMVAHDGNSPLVGAVDNNNKEMLEMLLVAGASVTEDAVEHCFMSEEALELLKVFVDTSINTVLSVVHCQLFEMVYVDQIECILQVLQNHEDCDQLEREIVDGHNLFYWVLADKEIVIIKKLKMFFQYYFTHEPADLLSKVFILFPDKLIGIHFIKVLSEIGVRGCWSEKQTFLGLWGGVELTGSNATARDAAVAYLQRPVLDLKRLSAMAARAHIRNYTGSNWMARLTVQEAALPIICKQQLLLEFAAPP